MSIDVAAEKRAYKKFIAAGMTPAGACGLIGNLEAESDGFVPSKVEYLCIQRLREAGKSYCTQESYNKALDEGRISCEEFLHPLPGRQYGYGLAQWTTPARKSGLWNLAHQKGVKLSDEAMQLEYLLKELRTSYPSVMQVLTTATSIRAASDVVLKRFECPANTGESVCQSRAARGEKFYNENVKEDEPVGDLWTKTAELMAAQSGYMEKASNANLDSKTGNAGYGNYTKYARDINNMGLMGCQGQPWCAVYQFWVCAQIFGKAKALEIMGNGFYNCASVTNHAKNNGTWHSTPKLGALIIFRNGAHIGRVTKVTDTNIYTNEGNTSSGSVNNVEANGGCVADKVYTRNYSGIDGYVWIDYGAETKPVKPVDNKVPVTDVISVSFPKLSKGCSGVAVKMLQQMLGVKVDGEFGEDTQKALKAFQKNVKLSPTGKCTKAVWRAILEHMKANTYKG